MHRSKFIIISFSTVGIICALLFVNLLMHSSENKNDEKPTLKIGYIPVTHFLLPIVATEQHRFIKVNVKLVKFSSWPELTEALKAGEIDGGPILNTLAIKLVEQGVPLKCILMASRNGSGIVVKKDIKNVNDLKNKIIAIPSRYSPHYIILQNYLSDNGLEMRKDVNIIEMSPPDMVPALASGSIDGYIVGEPFVAMAEDLGIGRVLAFSKNIVTQGSNDNEAIIVIRKEYIDKYPEAVQDFVEQIILSGLFVDKNPQETAKISAIYYGQKPEVIVNSLINPKGRTSFVDLYPRENEYENLQDNMLKLGLLQKSINIMDFVDDRFAYESYKKI